MADDTHRSVALERIGHGRFRATNARGGSLELSTGDDAAFTPVELLLAALGGCSSVDVDLITTKRSEPETFQVSVRGEKLRDDDGNHMGPLSVDFEVSFPDDDSGRSAAARVATAVRQSQERLCTVSRTIELATPVTMTATARSAD